MGYDAKYYRGQAAIAQVEADTTSLTNVRDRALRFVAAFEAMAMSVERIARGRAERERREQV